MIVSLTVEETNLVDSITLAITYEDAKQKLRSLVLLKIVAGKPTIQSFYSFSFPQ